MKIIAKKHFKEFIAFAASIFTTAALFADVSSTGNLSIALNGDGIPQLIALVITSVIYYRWIVLRAFFTDSANRERLCGAITATIFSVCMIIGKAQIARPDLKYGIFAVVLFLGYMPLFYIATLYLFGMIEFCAKKKTQCEPGKITQMIFEKHVIASVMLIVVICRLPYLIAFYPCSMSWDGGAQIAAFFGTEPFTNHHPPFMSFLYGAIAWYSREWNLPNIGMFAIPVMQTFVSAFAAANACVLYKRFKMPYPLRWGSLIYYAAFTVWCIFDATVIKDTLYYAFTLLFGIQLIYCVLDSDAFWSKKRNAVLLILYGFLMMQTRNNGVFVALFALPAAICLAKKKRGFTALISCVILLANAAVNLWLYPALGVINLEVKEDTYCIMFQQTAKYGQDYPEDVTDEEREILDKIFDYDEMVRVYNPRLADWVKNCMKLSEANSPDHTNKEFSGIKSDYFKVWLAQFKRHPMAYIEAFFECSYGYYYPEARPYKEGMGFYEAERNMLPEGMHPYRQIESLGRARFLIEQASKLEFVPGIGLLYRCGIYTWCMIFAAAYIVAKKRYRLLIAVIPPFVNILVCLVSPVNTCLRYAMPAMCMLPIVIGLMFLREEADVI